MSVNDLIKEGVSLFKSNNFDQAIAKFNQALDEIEDKNSQLEEQNNIQSWLGRCYSSQGIRIKNSSQAKDSSQNEVNDLFKGANGYFLHSLKLLSQFDDE